MHSLERRKKLQPKEIADKFCPFFVLVEAHLTTETRTVYTLEMFGSVKCVAFRISSVSLVGRRNPSYMSWKETPTLRGEWLAIGVG